MSTTQVDPWLAGKAELATAKAQAAAARITAQAEAADRAAARQFADRERRRAEKNERNAKRWAALAALGQVLLDHWQLLLWLPVIVAPGILAWDGQTAAGDDIFGPTLGWLLALFTECSAWALLARAEIRRRTGHPVAATLVAAWLVAGVGGALNYTHGAQDPGASWHGIVMALVSVSGFAVHQVSHMRLDPLAALRRWWTGRGRRRLGRAARRRARRFERAAVRSATAVLHPDGTVSLRYPSGPVQLTARRFAPWARRLVAGPAYSLAEDVARLLAGGPSGPASGWSPAPARQASGRPAATTPAAPSGTGPAGASGRADTPINRPERHQTRPDAPALSADDRVVLDAVRTAITNGVLPADPTGHAIHRHVMGGKGDRARAYRIRDALAAGNNADGDAEGEAGLRAVS